MNINGLPVKWQASNKSQMRYARNGSNKYVLQLFGLCLRCGMRENGAGEAESNLKKPTNIRQSKGNKMNTHVERRAETLNFMQSMLLQLGQMAKGERFDMLSYLIDMAYVECSDLIRKDHASIVEQHHRHGAA